MDSNEIFERLMKLRLSIIDGRDGEPLEEIEKAVLWDVAIALGLDDVRAGQVAGDPQPQPAAVTTVEPEPQSQPAAYDFSESGFGIGRLTADTDYAGEVLAQIEAAEIMRRQPGPRHELVLCSCGHYDAFPMSTARGTACVDCYDRMSD